MESDGTCRGARTHRSHWQLQSNSPERSPQPILPGEAPGKLKAVLVNNKARQPPSPPCPQLQTENGSSVLCPVGSAGQPPSGIQWGLGSEPWIPVSAPELRQIPSPCISHLASDAVKLEVWWAGGRVSIKQAAAGLSNS